MTHSHITRKKISHDTLTYNQEEKIAMTHSHITRKKIKPLVTCDSVMALFSSWFYVRVSWLYFLPGYI
jgi:hypothetical protein